MHCFVTFWCEGKQAKLRERERERETETEKPRNPRKVSREPVTKKTSAKNIFHALQPINRQTHPQTHKPTKPHTQKPINPQITHPETHKPTKPPPKKSRPSAENQPSRKRGARNAPTQAAEAQKLLQHARAGQWQSRSRSRDRQSGRARSKGAPANDKRATV